MKRLFSILLCSAVCLSMFAVPARPGARQFSQPDGTSIEAYVHGDECFHYTTDAQGYLLKRNAEGYWIRTQEQMTPAKVRARRAEVNAERRRQPMVGSNNLKTKGLVILAQFADKQFQTNNTRDAFDEMLNGDNYTYGGATGSVRQYYSDQSSGAFVPDLSVYGPVTLSKGYAEYGGNKSNGNDIGVGAMVAEACILAVDQFNIDLSKFDLDGDGYVDFVDVLYAGQGEADSDDENTIWPCEWDLRSSDYGMKLNLGGKTINTFSCHSELNGNSKRSGIGTACHELGHVFGLPDFYDYDYPTIGQWDIMDGGGYLNNGNTPPAFSGYERLFSGWAQPELLNSAAKSVELPDLKVSQKIYIISETNQHNLSGTDPDPVNFYILENRQQKGWDKYLPGHGMLVWRIQYSSSRWAENTPNSRPSDFQGVAIMAADGEVYHYTDDNEIVWTYGDEGDPYPGASGITSCESLPANWRLTHIAEDSKGNITFDFGQLGISVPTKTNIATNYDLSNNVVLALYFDEGAPVCNDIYLVGNHTDPTWSLDPSVSTKFEPLAGFDGWYVVSVPFKNGLQAKPIQIKGGELSWNYQTGDKGAWYKLGGDDTNSLNITDGAEDEADIAYNGPGAYVYMVKYFKKHNVSACTASSKHNYFINLYQPSCGDGKYSPAICGDFNNWQRTAMTKTTDGNGNTMYTITINSDAGEEYKFREVNDETTNWDNQIYYKDEQGYWKEFKNFQLPETDKDMTITHDFSDSHKYKYGLCEEEVDDNVYEIKVTVTVPEGAPKAGVEILGTFSGWAENPVKMTLQSGNTYTATITAKASDEFKFREAGTWDNEIVKLTSDGWQPLPNMIISNYWNAQNHTITLDFSSENFNWEVPNSEETTTYTIEPIWGQAGYYEQYDQYLIWLAQYENDEDNVPNRQGELWLNVDKLNGTFTLDDLDLDYSYFAIALAPGDTLYSETLEQFSMTVSKGEAYSYEEYPGYQFAELTLSLKAVDADGIVYIVPQTTFEVEFVGDKPVPVEDEYEIKVTVTVPDGAPKAGVEILGTFSDWETNAVLMTKQSDNVYTATITAKASDQFKFREAGTWDNEILQLVGENWQTMSNLVISNCWNEQNHTITLNYSGANYKWKGETVVEPTTYTIIPEWGLTGYYEEFDQYYIWFAQYENEEDNVPNRQGKLWLMADILNGTFSLDDLDKDYCYFTIAVAPGDTLYSESLKEFSMTISKSEPFTYEGYEDKQFVELTLSLKAVDIVGIVYEVPETTFVVQFTGDKPTAVEEEYDIKVTLEAPYNAPKAGVEILGTFSDWEAKAVAMTKQSGSDNIFTATIHAKASDEFKFREAGTWDNEIMHLEGSEWKPLPNMVISDYWNEKDHSITLQFNSKPYAWKANLGGETGDVPTTADLAEYYDIEENAVIAVRFEEGAPVCNDIVMVGSYNGWSEDPESCIKFHALEGFEGWYVAQVFWVEGLQAKPLQLGQDGTFHGWDYQPGGADAWTNLGDAQAKTADIITNDYGDEANVTLPSAGAYIYSISRFKNNNSPCEVVTSHNYTIVLYTPECKSGDYKPAIIGAAVGGWTESIPMNETQDLNGDKCYTYLIENGEAGATFKFRQAEISDWSNEIQQLNNESGEWENMGNLSLPTTESDITITFDFSNTDKYRWTLCEDKPQEEELNFDYEPQQMTTIEAEMTYVDYTDLVSEQGVVEIYMENEDMFVYLDLNVTSLDQFKGITSAVANINDSKQPGTVLASPGGNDEEDFPSFLATDLSDYGYSTAYYLASGTVSIEVVAVGVKIVVDAKSHFGSIIKLTYEGPITEYTPVGVENVEQQGKLDPNSPMYNVVGQRVSSDYRGVIIQKGAKFILR